MLRDLLGVNLRKMFVQEVGSGGTLFATTPRARDSAAMVARPAMLRDPLGAHLRKKGFHSHPPYLRLSRSMKASDQFKAGSRNFSSFNKQRSVFRSSVTVEEIKIKLKAFAKNCWDGLDPRVQNVIIDGAGIGVIVMVSSHGYLLYLKSMPERQTKLEACLAEIKEDSEKAIAELEAEVKSLSMYHEEFMAKHQKLETDLKELKFLKDLWMSIVYEESSKRILKSRRNDHGVEDE